MRTILLDTNFLLIPAQFGVDIFEEINRLCDSKHELVVSEASMQELKKIQESGRGKDKAAAKLAEQLIVKKGVKILKNPQKVFKGVDDFLLALAAKEGFTVATADRDFRKRLKKKAIPVIVLRKKQYLQLLG